MYNGVAVITMVFSSTINVGDSFFISYTINNTDSFLFSNTFQMSDALKRVFLVQTGICKLVEPQHVTLLTT